MKILEYSESQKCFHINWGDKKVSSNGYLPIFSFSNKSEKVDSFINDMTMEIHKSIQSREIDSSFETVKLIILKSIILLHLQSFVEIKI